jgi:hypothetical protein
MFHPPGVGPYPGYSQFCINATCIETATKRYTQRGTKLPPFDGRVAIRNVAKDQLPNVKGIQYIDDFS